MNVAVIGMGYVGTTMSVALSMRGHQVVGVDVDEAKIAKLKSGVLPFYEEGMERILRTCVAEKKLSFQHNVQEGISQCDVLMIAVGTPESVNGDADLRFVEEVANLIGNTITVKKTIVVKSTVPIGTSEKLSKIIMNQLKHRGLSIEFELVSNPEFLREGSALYDALHPERIVIGCKTEETKRMMEQLYHHQSDKLFFTTVRNAEMIKYASNTFLAAKISFVNELARLAERAETDITQITKGMGLDSRIGSKFLHAGIGYGGSCFPKDTKALLALGLKYGMELPILKAVTDINESQTKWFLEKIVTHLGRLNKKQIGLLGLTFKPNTDDIRESPAIRILDYLLDEGASVAAYDPKGMNNTRQLYPEVDYCSSPMKAIAGADAIILATEWPEIVGMDWEQAKQKVLKPYLFDGRNVLDASQLKQIGFHYVGVGVS